MPIIGNLSSAGKKPTTPTIGTATDDGTGTGVSVAFTPSTYIGKSTITYTALSSPGSLTGTGSGSPITVSGLTTGTAYTFTVKGDTNYGVASDYSAASNSVTPASPSSFESISTVTPNNTTSIYTFSSIPQTYKSLQLRLNTQSGAGSIILITFNGNTTLYNYQQILGSGSGTASVNYAAVDNGIYIYGAGYGTPDPGGATVGIMDIVDYASTAKQKTVLAVVGANNGATVSNKSAVQLTTGLYKATTAISSITIQYSSNITAGSIALYGVK